LTSVPYSAQELDVGGHDIFANTECEVSKAWEVLQDFDALFTELVQLANDLSCVEPFNVRKTDFQSAKMATNSGKPLMEVVEVDPGIFSHELERISSIKNGRRLVMDCAINVYEAHVDTEPFPTQAIDASGKLHEVRVAEDWAFRQRLAVKVAWIVDHDRNRCFVY